MCSTNAAIHFILVFESLGSKLIATDLPFGIVKSILNATLLPGLTKLSTTTVPSVIVLPVAPL